MVQGRNGSRGHETQQHAESAGSGIVRGKHRIPVQSSVSQCPGLATVNYNVLSPLTCSVTLSNDRSLPSSGLSSCSCKNKDLNVDVRRRALVAASK